MKIVTMIPYWSNYQYGDTEAFNRDTTSLSGRILLNYPIRLANKIKTIQQTYIFTNDLNIQRLLDHRLHFNFLMRDNSLDDQEKNIEDIISQFLSQVDADIIVLLHPKSPFLKEESLQECIHKVIFEGYDSAFIARSERKFAWLGGARINYDPKQGTPHLAQIQPIILETSSLYVFTRQCFNLTRTRIGNNPYIKIVNSFEGMVINTLNDLKMAEYLLDSQFQGIE